MIISCAGKHSGIMVKSVGFGIGSSGSEYQFHYLPARKVTLPINLSQSSLWTPYRFKGVKAKQSYRSPFGCRASYWEVFGAGQRAPYGSVIIVLVWVTYSLFVKLSCYHLWPHEALVFAPHLLDITYFSMVSCTQSYLSKNLHFKSFLLPLLHTLPCWPDSFSVDNHHYKNDSKI